MLRLLLRTKRPHSRCPEACRRRCCRRARRSASCGTTRYFDPVKTANRFGKITQRIGPLFREHKIGRANLTAAFPEKSPDEIEKILRVSGTIWAASAPNSRISTRSGTTTSTNPTKPSNVEFSRAHRRDFRSAARRRQTGADFRQPSRQLGIAGARRRRPRPATPRRSIARPNSAAADRAIHQTRAINMGTLIPASRDAPLKLAQALNEGKHVAMLVDQ